LSRLKTRGALLGVVAVAVTGGAVAGVGAAWVSRDRGASSLLPVADGFQLPFGDGTAGATYVSDQGVPYAGWYVAAGFLDQDYLRNRGALHPGEDWNGVGGGDTDLGQPVLAAGTGQVEAIDRDAAGWGNVVMLRHLLPSGEVVFTVYAHVLDIGVKVGDVVRRSERIARIGKGDGGRYWAHLHFEVRKANMAYFPPSYWPSSHGRDPAWVMDHYYLPRAFIADHPSRDMSVTTVARAGVGARAWACATRDPC
jgi:murein DD-endopeptidase MepM/ murein hydrolase activator NlpD